MSDAEFDRLFQAFADATRRDIVARVTTGEYSVSRLAEHDAMSFAAVQKHVAVLERASLVTKEKRGWEQMVRVHYEGLPQESFKENLGDVASQLAGPPFRRARLRPEL